MHLSWLRLRDSLLDVVPPIVALVALIALVQLVTTSSIIPRYLLPAPTDILGSFLASRIEWVPETLVTLKEILVGYFAAAALGIGLAIIIASSRLVRKVLYPYIILTQVVPMIALAPIIYILVGFNDLSRLIIVLLLSFFPIVIGTYTGLVSVDKNLIYLLKMLGAGQLKTFYKVRLPNSLPNMFVGLRIGMTGATVGAIVAEFVSSSEGLGFLIMNSLTVFDIPLAFVSVVFLILMGLCLYFGVEVIGRVLMPWSRRIQA